MKRIISLETKTYDLDWNRHVTSRTYERFGYEGRMEFLEELGYGIEWIIQNRHSILPQDTQVRFLAQQFSGAELLVHSTLFQSMDGLIHAHQNIVDKNEKPVCELRSGFFLLEKNSQPVMISSLLEYSKIIKNESSLPEIRVELFPIQSGIEYFSHGIQIKFSDMNCFWTVSNESVWKYFEEGRFLFFKEVIGFDSIHETDTTTFFMGGEIHIYDLPSPGTQVEIRSWIESIEKIRFYFRQDLVDSKGRVLASMKDEQLFIKLSKSRPCKIPEGFLKLTEKYRAKSNA